MKLVSPFRIFIYLAAFVAKEDDACKAGKPALSETELAASAAYPRIGRNHQQPNEIPAMKNQLTEIRRKAGVGPAVWSTDLLNFITKQAKRICDGSFGPHHRFTGNEALEYGFELIAQEFMERKWLAVRAMQLWANYYDLANKKCKDETDPDGCVPCENMIDTTVSHFACTDVDCDDTAAYYGVICHFGKKAPEDKQPN